MNISQFVEQMVKHIKMNVCVNVMENVENIEKGNVTLFINVATA